MKSFVYEICESTQQYLSELSVRKCLYSSKTFSNIVLSQKISDGIEWAQPKEVTVYNGKITCKIPDCHVLSSLFIPLPGCLSINFPESKHRYYFEATSSEEGIHVPIYLPFFAISWSKCEIVIDIGSNWNGHSVPLTIFCIKVIHDKLVDLHNLLNKQVGDLFRPWGPGGSTGKKVLFSIKGRLNIPYFSSDMANIKTASLEGSQLISAYVKPDFFDLLKSEGVDYQLLQGD